MNFVSIKGQQQLGSGLRLTVAVEVRAGSFQPPGSPIAYASTDEGGFAIALCDGSSDWGDGAHSCGRSDRENAASSVGRRVAENRR
jgi:hypothetical protein